MTCACGPNDSASTWSRSTSTSRAAHGMTALRYRRRSQRRIDASMTCLLVAALDRLSRGGVASLAGILDRLGRAGVGIRSLREEWLDTVNPLTRELLVAVFGWLGRVEREQFRSRIKSGMARARRDGKVIGRPRRAVDSDQAQRAVAKCGSLRAAATYLGISLGTLQRRLLAAAGATA